MKVTYVSACFDNSGYAEAARNNIAALAQVGMGVEVVPISFESFRSDLGIIGERVKGMVVEKGTSDIQIIHATPNVFPRFVDKSKYNIGYTTWETSKLPADWVDHINTLDEVWVPSQDNVEVFKKCGINIPIFRFPHAFNRELMEQETKKLPLPSIEEDEYVFYSVFQWTERKNPGAILKSYLTEFKKNEKVCLVLKTYLLHPGSEAEKEKIKAAIVDVKNRLYLKEYPKVLLITSLLSRQEIYQIHHRGDCYLSFHRSEGFGIPIAEAMMAGKPVISTRYGGPAEFVSSSVGYPVSYQETPCYGMPWETYTGDMVWADINVMEARASMRHAFENREIAKQKGQAGQLLTDREFSWESVGNKMKARLETIKEEKHVIKI